MLRTDAACKVGGSIWQSLLGYLQFSHVWPTLEAGFNTGQPSTFALVAVLNLVMQLGQMARPLVLQWLLAEDSALLGVLYVASLVSLQLFHVLVIEHWYYADARNSANTRSVLMMAVFRCGLEQTDVGKLTNLMATDADRIAGAAICLRMTNWTLNTLRLPYTVWMLYRLLGGAGFVGVGAVVAVHVATYLNGQCMAASMSHIQNARDEKSRLVSAMLKGFKLIRMHGCEDAWRLRIEAAREKELDCTVTFRLQSVAAELVNTLLSLSVPLSIFAWYTLVQGATLTASVAFPALSWIDQLRQSIGNLPDIIFVVSQESSPEEGVAARLVDASLAIACSESIDLSAQLRPKSGHAGGEEVTRAADADHGSNEHPATKSVFEGVNLQVRRGELTIVCGESGAGKSTLLAALACARPLVSGRLEVMPSRSYVTQQPCMLSSTLRANVLFGLPLDTDRYQRALEDAALQSDLKVLPHGDSTYVGEGGVQLSGGQRSRLMLARAIYSDADVHFLDDVFSAVDMPTGQLLWGSLLRLRAEGKTVVLVTHQLQLLRRPEVDRIACIHGGVVRCLATWAELQLMAQSGRVPELMTLLSESGQLVGQVVGEASEAQGAREDDTEMAEGGQPPSGTSRIVAVEAAATSSGKATQLPLPLEHRGDGDQDVDDPVTLRDALQRFTTALKQSLGRQIDTHLIERLRRQLSGEALDGNDVLAEAAIAPAVYSWYLGEYGSAWLRVLLVAISLLAAAFAIADRVWLARWTEGNSGCDAAAVTGDAVAGACDAERQRRALEIFMGLGMISAGFVASETVVNQAMCAPRASRAIHQQVLSRLMHATTEFFDTTASGQIVNRLLTDVKMLDWEVAQVVAQILRKAFSIVTNVVVILLFAPFVLPLALALVPLYLRVFAHVRCANRDCRRIHASAHSPVYSNFSDVVAGRETVRAFRAEQRFISLNEELVGKMAQAQLGSQGVLRWAALRYMLLGMALYTALAVSCVALVYTGRMSLPALGFVLVQGERMVYLGVDAVNLVAEVEVNFVAVERLLEYSRLECEEGAEGESHRPDLQLLWNVNDDEMASPAAPARGLASEAAGARTWRGALQLRNVWFRYQLYRPHVLRGLSLSIEPGSKVALCGRTGCGKSSLFSAILRMYGLERGAVSLDGVALHHAPVRRVRSAIRLVAQDALLLDGSLLENLYTFGETSELYDRQRAWEELEAVGMRSRIEALPEKLDTHVSSGSFSEGERQLISLCRAFLSAGGRQTLRVLLCDEPTSNVDVALDQVVHRTLLRMPQTLVMICHRLVHIGGFDRVLVLDSGRVAEDGAPDELLSSPDSLLRGMWNDMGLPCQDSARMGTTYSTTPPDAAQNSDEIRAP